MTENIGNILFIVAGGLWAIELIPQLIKTIRTKSVKDISLFFLTLCFIAYIVFLTGCYFIKNWYLILSSLIPFINVCILLYLVLRYSHPKKRKTKTPLKTVKLLEDGTYVEEPYIIGGVCINKGEHICNKGYACDACPHNKEKR